MYANAPPVCLVLHRGQKRAPANLKLELWVVLSHPVGDPNLLQEQEVLRTAEVPFQPLASSFLFLEVSCSSVWL